MRFAIAVALALAASCTPGPDDGASASPRTAGAYTWQARAGLPTPRTEVAAAVVETQVFVVGGFTSDGKASDAVEVFDVRDDDWRGTFPSLPEPLHHTAMVASGSRLYVFGGYREDGRASASVWTLETRSRDAVDWERRPDMPTARGAHAAVLVGDVVHVVGGATGSGGRTNLVAAHDVFDLERQMWSTFPALPDPRDHLAAAAIGHELYVVGGRKLSAARNTGRLDVFDTQTRSWARGPDMPTPRGGIAAATLDDKLFVFGGEEPAGTFSETEIYDPSDESWRAGPPMPTARHGLGAATMPVDRIAVVAGGPQPGLTVSDVIEFLILADG